MQDISEINAVQKKKYGCEEIFKSEDEMRQDTRNSRNFDLYLAGNIWMAALKIALVGANICLIPRVHAATDSIEPMEPVKPPRMRLSELPIYDTPHKTYKESVEDQITRKCTCKPKIMHAMIYPHVKRCSRDIGKSLSFARKEIKDTYNDVSSDVANVVKQAKEFMRDPANLTLRQGCLAVAAISGYYVTSKKSMPIKIFSVSLGAFLTGMLCFPKETDEYFRNLCYYTGKCLIAAYNVTCGKNFALKERMPCARDLPKPPQNVIKDQCIKKK